MTSSSSVLASAASSVPSHTPLPFHFLCVAGCSYRVEIPVGCVPDYRATQMHQAACPWYRFACTQWAAEAAQRAPLQPQPAPIAAATASVVSRKRGRDASPAATQEPAIDDEPGDMESEAAERHPSPVPPVKQQRLITDPSPSPAPVVAAAAASAAPVWTPVRSAIPRSPAASSSSLPSAAFRTPIPPRHPKSLAAIVPASPPAPAAAASSAAAAAAASASNAAPAARTPDTGMPPLEPSPFLAASTALPAAAAASSPSGAAAASKFHSVVKSSDDEGVNEESEDEEERARPPSPKAELSNSGRRMRRCGAPVRLVNQPLASSALHAAQPDCRQPERKFAKVAANRMRLLPDTQLHYLGQSLPIYQCKASKEEPMQHWINMDELMTLMVRDGLFTALPPVPTSGSSALQWLLFYRDSQFEWTPRCGDQYRESGCWGYDREISRDTRMVGSAPFVTTRVVDEMMYLAHLDDDAERIVHDKADTLKKLLSPLHATKESTDEE